MTMQRLAKGAQKTTPFMRLVASKSSSLGVPKKAYEPDGKVRLCNFSTYGGTERDVNGIISIEDTGEIVAWYDPTITSADRIRILTGPDFTGSDYEILGEPENMELRGQEMKIKVRRVKGGA